MNKQVLRRLEEFDKLPGWLHPDEGRLLYTLAVRQKNKGTIVEIGSYKGKSTCFLAQAGRKIYAIDPHLGVTGTSKKSSPSWKEFNNNIKKFGFGDRVRAIKKTSEQAAKGWTKPISLLNIDGLHDYENVQRDLSLWLPHLVDGGIVVCHDAFGPSYPGVMKAIRETIINTGDFRGGGVLGSQFFAEKGQPRNKIEMVSWKMTKYIIVLTSRFWNQNLFVAGILLKPFYQNSLSIRAMPRRFFGWQTFP